MEDNPVKEIGNKNERVCSAADVAAATISIDMNDVNGCHFNEDSSIIQDNQQVNYSPGEELNEDCEVLKAVENVHALSTKHLFQVFMAKYNYDPVQFSPNDNPEAELTLSVGDYLFIYGEMDEDGFYEGELMDGRRGLAPSNFIEKVPEEDLDEVYPMENEPQNNIKHEINRFNSYSYTYCEDGSNQQTVSITELSDNDSNGQSSQPYTPAPRDLHLERHLTNSCVISWSPPDGLSVDEVKSYKVFLDERLVTTVKSNDRTKALLEKIDSSKSHKISVRAISIHGESTDHQCTITIGKGNRLTPSALDVTDITKTSACVSWNASSSYIEHMVSVDGQWETITGPGIHRCLITGLLPSVTYTVSVTCIANLQHLDDNLRTASVSFVTLPHDFPDPPHDVQVEPGPQHGTLLVTWSPVVNSGLVTGYCIYANGIVVKELISPTGDHVVLDCGSLLLACRDPKQITVRTSTFDCRQSHDSSPAILSQIMIEEIKSETLPSKTTGTGKLTKTESGNIDKKVELHQSNDPADIEGNKNICIMEEVTQTEIDDTKTVIQTTSSRQHRRVPHIEITKDSMSDSSFDNCSEQGLHIIEIQNGQSIHEVKDTKEENVSKSKQMDKLQDNNDPHQQRSSSSSIQSTRDKSHATKHGANRKQRDYFNRGRSSGSNRSFNYTEKDEQRSTTGDVEIVDVSSPIDNYEPDSLVDSSETEWGVNQVRIFIALFEYNPATMSPNSGAVEEELPFSEGQLIKVFGDKDLDGFYVGEANGLRGLVPCNMVSEVQIDNPDLAEQLIKESINLGREKSRSRIDSTKTHRRSNKNKLRDTSPSGVITWSNMGPSYKMMALYDYNPHELSPNVDKKLELSFQAGDIITVFGDIDFDGFYHGQLNRQYGLVPSNFLKPIETSPNELQQSPHRHLPSSPRGPLRSSPVIDSQQNKSRETSMKPGPDFNVIPAERVQRLNKTEAPIGMHQHHRHGDLHPPSPRSSRRMQKPTSYTVETEEMENRIRNDERVGIRRRNEVNSSNIDQHKST